MFIFSFKLQAYFQLEQNTVNAESAELGAGKRNPPGTSLAYQCVADMQALGWLSGKVAVHHVETGGFESMAVHLARVWGREAGQRG